jgi:hypothetical protein
VIVLVALLLVVLSGRLDKLPRRSAALLPKAKGFSQIALKVYGKIPITEEPVVVGLVSVIED